jgi:hypothetical protein
MSGISQGLSAISQPPLREEANRRKQYRKPQLEELGDLRTLTLGGSGGVMDSGSEGVRKPIGSLSQPEGFPPSQDGFPTPGDPFLP